MGRKRNTNGADATDAASASGNPASGQDGSSSTPLPSAPAGSIPSLPAGAVAPSAGLQTLLATNPGLLLSNPLLAVSMLNNGLLNGVAAAKAPPPPEIIKSIDPDVQELCDNFHIEDRHLQRLNEIMKKRQDTFEGDMLKLWEKLEDAREPAGLLVVKMREMEEGTFIGKQKTDKELANIVKKYELDHTAETRLADILARFETPKRMEMYEALERHLEVSNRPSAMVMMLLRKLSEGQQLGRPGPVAPGSYLDRKNRENRESKESRDRDRDRDRDRREGRDRDRDRERRDRDRPRRSRSRSRRR